MRDPIQPADIRVGDRVERRYVDGDHETIERFEVKATGHRAVSSCRLSWGIEAPRIGTAEWYLLDRPDPLAEVVEVVTKELLNHLPGLGLDFSRAIAREVIAAIRETHDIVPKGGE